MSGAVACATCNGQPAHHICRICQRPVCNLCPSKARPNICPSCSKLMDKV